MTELRTEEEQLEALKKWWMKAVSLGYSCISSSSWLDKLEFLSRWSTEYRGRLFFRSINK